MNPGDLVYLNPTDYITETVIVGEKWDHICPLCRAAGKTSTITMSPNSFTTAMYSGTGHYDEKGVYVPPPKRNTRTCEGACSNGHRIIEAKKVW